MFFPDLDGAELRWGKTARLARGYLGHGHVHPPRESRDRSGRDGSFDLDDVGVDTDSLH